MSIQKKIKTHFDANPDLRVLFFFDETTEHRLLIDPLEVPDVTLLVADRSLFKVKVDLEQDLVDKKVLLYFPSPRPEGEAQKSFIFLDLLLANKELLLDDVADFMDEYKLLPHQRPLAKRYIKDLKLKKNQKVLAKILTQTDFREKEVVKGLICCYLEFPGIMDSTHCLAKLFTLTLPENSAHLRRFIELLENAELQSTIVNWLYHFLGYSTQEFSVEHLVSALRSVKYNLLTQHLPELKAEDPYSKLRIKDQVILQRFNTFIVDWENDPNLGKWINPLFSTIREDVKEKLLVDIYGVDSEYTFYTDDLKYLIIRKSIQSTEFQPERTLKTIQRLSGSVNEQFELKTLLAFLKQASNMFQALNGIGSYVLDMPDEYINRYAEEYSKIDFAYRKAIVSLNDLERMTLPNVIELDELIAQLHTAYEHYLINLNREWLNCLDHFQFKLDSFQALKQHEFFKKNIAERDQKIAVIVSDALRFEVANELLDELRDDPKGVAEISPMLAGIPSVTKWGMANLVSDRKLSYGDDAITIEGISTEGTNNRQKILKLNVEDAVAIQYSKLMRMPQGDARQLFKSQVVYIYHDTIDATGDDRKSEMNTFDAVDSAIRDLKSLVKKIHSSYNVARVIVTADHGFLFNYRELSEATLLKIPSGKHLVEHSRYLITEEQVSAPECYSFKLSECANVDSELHIAIPRSINRYRRPGAGVHFVHGGASLQELIVPVIESNRKRDEVSSKVDFKLLNEHLKIVSGAIKIRIYQEQPVSSDVKAREVVAGIFNQVGELASNEAGHILDSHSELPSERTREFILNLSSQSSQESILYLKMFDKADDRDRLNPLVNEKVINSTLIESDF